MKRALHGILRNEAGAAARVAALTPGTLLQLLCEGDLGAAVSLIPDETSGPPDPKVHALVVQALHDACTVLPARHGTCFDADARVREFLRAHGGQFRRALDDVKGFSEMGVRAIGRPRPVAPAAAAAAQAMRSPGQAYMAARQSHYAARDAVQAEVSRLSARIQSAFEGLCAKCRTESFFVRGQPVLSLHFLVRREKTERFRRAFRRLEECAPEKLLLTGPWPPYNFTSCEDLPSL